MKEDRVLLDDVLKGFFGGVAAELVLLLRNREQREQVI